MSIVVEVMLTTLVLAEEFVTWLSMPPEATVSVGMEIAPVPDCVKVPEPALPTVRLVSPAGNVAGHSIAAADFACYW